MSLAKVTKLHILNESWTIGMRRVDKIVEQEESNGYIAISTGIYSHLADIIVIDPNMTLPPDSNYDPIVRVYEVTNYNSPDEYIQLARAERYRDNLIQFKAKKIFVCSYEENLRYLPDGRGFFEQHGIEVRVVGAQD